MKKLLEKVMDFFYYVFISILGFSVGYIATVMWMTAMVMVIKYLDVNPDPSFIYIFIFSIIAVYLVIYFIVILVFSHVYKLVKKAGKMNREKRAVFNDHKPFKIHWLPVKCLHCDNYTFKTCDLRADRYRGWCKDCITVHELGREYLDE